MSNEIHEIVCAERSFVTKECGDDRLTLARRLVIGGRHDLFPPAP
jgi:hypothetical protein